MPKGRSRLRQRAIDLADLRYGTQASGLRQLLRDAEDAFNTTVSTQQGAARGISAAARAATPGLTKVYSDAQQSAARSQGGIAQLLSGLGGPAGDTFRALIGAEAGGSAARLEESKAAGLAELSDRQTRAKEGAAYATANAASQYLKDVGRIHQSQQDLAAQKGLYVSTTLGDLQEKRAARAVTKRGQDITRQNAQDRQSLSETEFTAKYGLSPDEFAKLPNPLKYLKDNKLGPYKPSGKGGGKTKGKGKGAFTPATPGQQNTIVQSVKTAASLVKADLGKPMPAAKDSKGKPVKVTLSDGTEVKPGTKLTGHILRDFLRTGKNPLNQRFDPDVVNAAFDLAVLGGLSHPNVVALHNMGVRVRGRFPLHTPPRQKTLPKYPR